MVLHALVLFFSPKFAGVVTWRGVEWIIKGEGRGKFSGECFGSLWQGWWPWIVGWLLATGGEY